MKSNYLLTHCFASLVLVFSNTYLVYAQDINDLTSTASNWTIPSNEYIRTMLTERMQQNGVGVVVGVIDSNGRRVVSNGVSGASDGRPLNGDTIFQIGSITKTFTTLLLADMVERGEVSLDDIASAYLPSGVSMPERGRPVTLRDLATHMSGLPTMPMNFDISGRPDPYEAYTVDQLYEFLSNYSLEREPGTERAYSNLGVALLGRLLAYRAGMEYEALLRQRVLEPLDMESTSISLNDDQLHRLALGHDTYLKPVHSWEMVTLSASGSLRSTANDMLKQIDAYLGNTNTSLGSAINIQLSEKIWSPTRPNGVIGHSGGKQGYRSGLAINLELGIGVVVLANARTSDLPQNIALHLATGEPLAPALPAPTDKPRIVLTRAALDSYAGSYQFSNGAVFEIARNQSHLVVRYPNGAILEFVATKPHEFFYSAGNDDIEFKVDSDGIVRSLILYGDGKNSDSFSTAQRI